MISREEVARRRAELEQRRNDAKAVLDHIRVDFQHLYLDCGHPNKTSGSFMGRVDWTACEDCGWED